jgi:hypothetical protein
MKKLAVVALLMPFLASARPISYPGGITIMQENNFSANNIHGTYTVTKDYAIGAMYSHKREREYNSFYLMGSSLVFRKNSSQSQASFYLNGGVGVSVDGSKTEEAALIGISTDWEDRRYFIRYENSLEYSGDIDKNFSESFRVGIAPYIGNYGDIHTWLMLELDHTPGDKNNFTLTPLVRFFKDNYLIEIGSTTRGEPMFNFIIRF